MKKILGRDVNVIEPTLGFNIETIPVELEGDDQPYQVQAANCYFMQTNRFFHFNNFIYKISGIISSSGQCLGCGRTEKHPNILEKLFRTDGRTRVGSRL